MAAQRWRRTLGSYVGFCIMALTTLAGCSLRAGAVAAGPVPPPDGAQMARRFLADIARIRHGLSLPPLRQDPSLGERADTGLQIIDAGIPDGTSVIDHLTAVGGLPNELQFAVGFEDDARGLTERDRDLARRRAGKDITPELLASDPALDAIGSAARGPWSVVVIRSRLLRPDDGLPLQAALHAGITRARPALRPDAGLAAVAADVASDGTIDYQDQRRFSRAGGVPVRVSYREDGPALMTSYLNSTLVDEGPGSLREPWLNRFGVAARVADDGTMLFVVLATGEPDLAGLNAQLRAVEPQATELINGARAEAGLPPVRLDPVLVEAARIWVAESTSRGCEVGYDAGCPWNVAPPADWWLGGRTTWWSPEEAFDFYLAPARPGEERLTRCGAAASVGSDGMVWSALLCAL